MTSYIAKQDIGEFKKGDSVPEAQALVWINMYKYSPVEEKGSGTSKKKSIDDMNKTELLNYAKENQIEVNETMNAVNILKAIKAVEKEREEAETAAKAEKQVPKR